MKELEAHQQRKLGLQSAEKAYEELIYLAVGIQDARERDLTLARSKRYLAEVVHSNFPGNAWRIMTSDVAGAQYYPGAIPLIYKCEPLAVWERLESGDMHYFAALCAHELGYPAAEPFQLGEAEAAYRRILIVLSDRRSRWPRKFRRLRKKAAKGIERVAEAHNGSYDRQWLPN